MFVSPALLLLALQQIVVPLGKPPPHPEPVRAPIETYGPLWAQTCAGATDESSWTKPAPAVRIHANVYLVGTCGISSILITSPGGDVLIDGGPERAADLIADNIRSLGFRMRDVRWILQSHEHPDHVGGIAKLQQLTGASVIASAAAARAMANGTTDPADPQAGSLGPYPKVVADRIVSDGQMLRLGDINIQAHATPGHTPGALSWSWESCDGAVCRSMVYADSLSPVSGDAYRFSAHPDTVAAFRASLAKVAGLRCEILLTPHPSASGTTERLNGDKPLFNPAACKEYAGQQGRALDDRLSKEAARK
ncbi:subclass B3 metallo-beta-lactamase [Sphingomonas sp. KRR8]|uniref:subclass B3 metallo-beta-lactamase n=1 Tax=Sphingomonas sp. KRR8 TaxID=2942996 RepID=UPI002020986D|nr:subclass B3 metallo-beta-lactamase [Sphingomonas sp. KRR8]URD59864.1 subclass B3 metallo-beta-lactamase [Sphingomonas sp. KRR8]